MNARTLSLGPSSDDRAVVSKLTLVECAADVSRVMLPAVHAHIVVRLGAHATGGVDVNVVGVQMRAKRKLLRAGQRAVMARLPLGASAAWLGAPPEALAGRVVALDELWGRAAVSALEARLIAAPSLPEAARLLEDALARRAPSASADAHTRLALRAAASLSSASVRAVASELRVSERTLRRAFRETVGLSPKAYARLARFRRALARAHAASGAVDWAAIAAREGYCDQAHMIAEFRALVGATPAALLRETPLDHRSSLVLAAPAIGARAIMSA